MDEVIIEDEAHGEHYVVDDLVCPAVGFIYKCLVENRLRGYVRDSKWRIPTNVTMVKRKTFLKSMKA